jgi:ABC-type multidrug transport system fused ATPase/permease subunit
MQNQILIRQNEPHLINLLKASAVAYTKAKYWEIRITCFLLFLSVAYPIAYVLLKDLNTVYILFGCSFILVLLIVIFSGGIIGNTSMGAIFKEEYDVQVFNLPWKSTLKKPGNQEVMHYAQQYKKKWKEIKDWYSIKLFPGIEHNISVAILQHSITSWDIELRKKYSSWLLKFLVFYSVVLLIILFVLKAELLTVFLLLFSLLSFYTHFIALLQGHAEAINRREVISSHLDNIIRNKKQISLQELRDIQDEIYLTRLISAKVPNFFFRKYKKQMSFKMDNYLEEVNQIYKS